MEIKYKEPAPQGSEVIYVSLFCWKSVVCLLTWKESGLESTDKESTSDKPAEASSETLADCDDT